MASFLVTGKIKFSNFMIFSKIEYEKGLVILEFSGLDNEKLYRKNEEKNIVKLDLSALLELKNALKIQTINGRITISNTVGENNIQNQTSFDFYYVSNDGILEFIFPNKRYKSRSILQDYYLLDDLLNTLKDILIQSTLQYDIVKNYINPPKPIPVDNNSTMGTVPPANINEEKLDTANNDNDNLPPVNISAPNRPGAVPVNVPGGIPV